MWQLLIFFDGLARTKRLADSVGIVPTRACPGRCRFQSISITIEKGRTIAPTSAQYNVIK